MSKNIAKKEFSVWYTIKSCITILWGFDRPYAISQIAFSIYSALIAYLTIHMVGYFLDIVISGQIQSLSDPDFMAIFLVYICVLLFNRIISAYNTNVENDFSRRFSAHLNDLLSRKRTNLELAQLDDPQITNLSSKANDNVGMIRRYLNLIVQLSQEIYSIITALVIVLPYSVALAAINMILVIPEYFVSRKIQKDRYNLYDENVVPRRKYGNYRGFLTDTKPMREVKLGGIAEYLIGASRNIMDVIHASDKRLDDQRFKLRIIVFIGGVAGFAITLYSVYNDLLATAITVGFATILTNQANSLRASFSTGFFRLNELESQSMYLQDVFKFLELKPTLVEGSIKEISTIKNIEIEKVSFKYPEQEKYALKNITLNIPKGSKVAIVGENGAGKSTLTKLLLRYYDPTEGTIKLNDQSLSDFDRQSLYKLVSYMPQDYNRYPYTLKEVVTLGESIANFDTLRYEQALRISQVDLLLPELKHGEDTILSPRFEGGTELSTGQAQKVALARVLYRPCDILILDEPTSAIDAISELHIFNHIEKLPNSQTVILISHRFNTVKNADIIVVLEHGTIVESGNHQQLMDNKSRYYEMYTAQKDSYE